MLADRLVSAWVDLQVMRHTALRTLDTSGGEPPAWAASVSKLLWATWHRRLGELAELGWPIAFGSSRKAFIGKLTGAGVDQRLGGTIASNVIAYANGARMLRVHDVGPMRHALTVAEAVLDPASRLDRASP